jgi:hypothetical protein
MAPGQRGYGGCEAVYGMQEMIMDPWQLAACRKLEKKEKQTMSRNLRQAIDTGIMCDLQYQPVKYHGADMEGHLRSDSFVMPLQ